MTKIKERPALMNGEMVRQTLAGVKTNTRRIMKVQPSNGWAFENPPVLGRITSSHPKKDKFGAFIRRGAGTDFPETDLIISQFGMPGDSLYVRETFALSVIDPDGPPPEDDPENYDVIYRADDNPMGGWTDAAGNQIEPPWKPSIHMPRWASRIDLEVTSVRVERLQDISEADAKAEGAQAAHWLVTDAKAVDLIDWPLKEAANPYRNGFALLWESIYGNGSWAANPWVWVYVFKRVVREQNHDDE